MDIVTFETAIKLKEAGFFQPHPFSPDEPVKGCFYVSEIIETTSLLDDISDKPSGRSFEVKNSLISFDFDNATTKGFNSETELLYAPTATEILRHMPDISLVYDTSQIPTIFSCYDTNWSIFHENPAEAAAIGYLSIHEKSKT